LATQEVTVKKVFCHPPRFFGMLAILFGTICALGTGPREFRICCLGTMALKAPIGTVWRRVLGTRLQNAGEGRKSWSAPRYNSSWGAFKISIVWVGSSIDLQIPPKRYLIGKTSWTPREAWTGQPRITPMGTDKKSRARPSRPHRAPRCGLRAFARDSCFSHPCSSLPLYLSPSWI